MNSTYVVRIGSARKYIEFATREAATVYAEKNDKGRGFVILPTVMLEAGTVVVPAL